MPRVSPIFTNINGGEVSPLLHGRVDLAKYPNSYATVENFLPLAQGPAARREGFRYIANTRNDAVARLIPFEFSTVQAYVIEATDLKFRFYKGRAQIVSGTPVELAVPYAAADLAALRWAQSADVLYLAHQSHAPRKLTRTSHTSWSISTVAFLDGPYLDVRSDLTITPSGTSGSVTLTASAALFAAGDVGRLVRLKHGSTWSWCEITAYTSTTQVTATVKSTATTASASAAFRLGAFYPGNYPAVVTFFEERLTWANTPAQPQTIWASVSGDYENMAPSDAGGTVADDSALTFTISDDRVNAIRWLSAGAKGLAIGTVGGEFTMQATSLGEVVTPSNVTVRRETTRGSADVPPVRIGAAVLFVQRARRKLFEFVYNFEADGQVAPEMTLLAGHVVRAKIAALAWQGEPRSVLWCAMDDGTLAGMTYMRDQQVIGWHRHPLGGTGAKVLSLACIPGADEDDLYAVVERTVNGSTVRFVEVTDGEFWPDNATDREYAFFVDAGATYDSPVAQTLTLSATTGSSVTATAGGGTPFSAGDVGREIRHRWLDAASRTYRTAVAVITAYGSATVVTVTITAAFPATSLAASTWRLTVTTVSGLSYLEGETVAVLADGAAHPDCVVASGAIALARKAAIVQAGLPYTSLLTSLDLESGSADGTAQGKRKRIHEVVVRFHATLGAEVGAVLTEGTVFDRIEFRAGAAAMDAPPPLFTGDKPVVFPQGWAREARVSIRQTQPLPCTIAAIMPRLSAGGS